MVAKLSKHFKDIYYSVFAEVYSHYIEFKVYPIFAIEHNTNAILWEKRESPIIDGTKELDKAQVFLSGSIKWNNCSNWKFDIQDKVMLHFCSKQESMNLGILFERLYKIAEDHVPHYTEFN